MKIVFLRSSTNAVGEYRVRHPMMALSALGHECSMLTLDHTPQRVSNEEIAGDVLVLARQTSEAVFDLWESLPAERRPVLVYEVDDNPWEWHSWDPIHTQLGYDYGKRVLEVMGKCSAVTCSTPTLAARIRREFPKMPIWVVPNAIDYTLRDWTVREDRAVHDLADKIVLGWTGSIHHTRDAQDMLPAIATIFDAYPETVFLMQCDVSVYRAWIVALQGYKDRLRWAPPLPFAQHPAIYSLFDINLAPLEVTPFNVCKSDLRLIEGGAHGVPYVASKIAPYLEFSRMSDGIGGHLASTPSEWVSGIADLLDGEREARGQSLARYVRETRSLEVVAGQWQAALEGAVKGAATPLEPPVEALGRNSRCPCGSGLKVKRCCQSAYGAI